jgi:UDP-N-acetylglucosamine 2-epimerase (non-hydrolysing)
VKIINVVGARPNFMKIAPLMTEMKKHPGHITPLLLHTGQHYDEKMSDLFFRELGIPKPDIYLGVGSDTHARQVAKIMMEFDEICTRENPDAILVVGDVNSTMACSLVAAKRDIKIIHMEAGLRSYDRTMPEEINRLVTDTLADLLLIPSEDAIENLHKEGIADEKIHLVGNVMIDTLFHFLPLAKNSKIMGQLKVEKGNFVLVTLHRPSNVDTVENLKKILETLVAIQKTTPVVFPIHPRTLKNIEVLGLKDLIKDVPNLILTEPLGYLDFQQLMSNSLLVVTDSGGLQEETTALKIPCITVRENTERPVTISLGSNELIGMDMEKLLNLYYKAKEGKWKSSSIPELWDGKTSERVVQVLLNHLK